MFLSPPNFVWGIRVKTHRRGAPEAAQREDWTIGAVDSVEIMAILVAAIDADLMVLDAGQDPPLKTHYFSKK